MKLMNDQYGRKGFRMLNARIALLFYGVIIVINIGVSTVTQCATACALTRPQREQVTVGRYALPQTADERALIRACSDGFLQNNAEIERLLAKGTNPNVAADHDTLAIVLCIMKGNIEAVRMFIHHGIDINSDLLIYACLDYSHAYQEVSTRVAAQGTTLQRFTLSPLENQVIILVTILQKLKAAAHFDINARYLETGATALMHAAQNHIDLVVPLLECHANPLLQDVNGKTALMRCAESGAKKRAVRLDSSQEYPITKLLVDAGSSVAASDLQGQTVLRYSTNPRSRCLFARHQEYPHIAELIDRDGFQLPPLITLVMAYLQHDHEAMTEADFPQLSPKPLAPKKEPAKKTGIRSTLRNLFCCCALDVA